MRLAYFVAVHCVLSGCLASATLQFLNDRSSITSVQERDGSHHHHTGAPLAIINETEIALHHAPTPPSYYTLDWADHESRGRPSGLMIMHAIFMSLAFFVSLPISIALRSVRHGARGVATLSFFVFCAIGCAASGLYRKLSLNMYEGAVHSGQSYFVILIALSLSTLDIVAAVRRFIGYLRDSDRSARAFWSVVVQNNKYSPLSPEYESLTEEGDEFVGGKDSIELQNARLGDDSHNSSRGVWSGSFGQHRRHDSLASEQTVCNNNSDETLQDLKHLQTPSKTLNIFQVILSIVERGLVLAGFMQLLVGIVTYTGGCRENYLNGCLAHLIKGGIFWCYGLLSFSRFLGSYADLGWAWNKAPSAKTYTAEFVECLVIFLYGATNTWMERFGANAGDPFTTKQIQHISIAVMFWFAGLLGMGIESKTIRRWLASSPRRLQDNSQNEDVVEPPSYRGSFNPFPALVIGVTGIAMAAHMQTYAFQVQIHSLWGTMLAAFAVLRSLTYFFLWLNPPQSTLPSRPPTEALGSFFLACGGLVFMFSTEELTLAALRQGRDDVMMFLNVAVAITCFSCCWTLLMTGFKGWLRSRNHVPAIYQRSTLAA